MGVIRRHVNLRSPGEPPILSLGMARLLRCCRVAHKNDQDAADAAKQLQALPVDERVALYVRRESEALFVGCEILWELPQDAMLRVADSDRRAPFFSIFYRIEGLKSGMHHPDGMLWVRHPDKRHCVHRDRVPLTAIAPTILEMFGVTPPALGGCYSESNR